MTIQITVRAWYALAYLAIGVVLFVPLAWGAHRALYQPPPFWPDFWRNVRRQPLRVVLVVLLWPLGAWEAVRDHAPR